MALLTVWDLVPDVLLPGARVGPKNPFPAPKKFASQNKLESIIGNFGAVGYYVDTVGKNKAKIQDYIKHQLGSDKLGGQLSPPSPGSPFTGLK